MATRQKKAAPARMLVQRYGPFIGVNDTDDPAGADWERYLSAAVNVMIRPGSTSFEARSAQFAGLSARTGTCRGIYQFAKKDGTQYPIGFFDDVGSAKVRCYRLDTGVEVTHTGFNLATGGGTIFAVAFNDVMICTDGAHVPFFWDAAGGAATNIAFNVGSGVAYGAPWVYLAKLFFIRADARGQFVWSEETDQTTGYQQVNYANFWNFQQSSNAPLCAGVGTNDGMYIFRAGSIAYVTGAVTANFSTTGTFDGVSDHIGCPCPSAIVRVAQTVFFLDRYGRLHRAGPDPNVTPMYAPATITCSTFGATLGDGTTAANALPPVQLAYLPSLDLLIHQQPSASYPSARLMVWDRVSGNYYGIWTDESTELYTRGMTATVSALSFQTLGVANSASGNDLVLWLANNNFVVQYIPAGAGLAQATPTKACAVSSGPLLYSPAAEKVFEEIESSVEVGPNFSGTLGVVLWTNRYTSMENVNGSASTPGMGTGASLTKTTYVKVREGLKARGRWMVYQAASGNQTVDGFHNGVVKFLDFTVRAAVSGETSWNEFSYGYYSGYLY